MKKCPTRQPSARIARDFFVERLLSEIEDSAHVCFGNEKSRDPPIAAVRLLRKLLPGTESDNEASMNAGLANTILTRTFSAEGHLVSRVRFPFGVSLLVLAR